MKKLVSLSFLLFFFIFLNLTIPSKTLSDELDDISKQIQDLTNELNSSIKATKPLESELNNLKNQISGIKTRLTSIEDDIVVKEKNIQDGYKNLAKQEETLAKAISDYYIKTYYNSPFWVLLSASSVTDVTQILAYQKQAVDQDKAIITNIVISIQSLEEKKKNLENEKNKLSSLKEDLDEQSGKLDKIVSGAKAYQSTLSSKIAQLTAHQQQIIAQKLGSLNIPLFAYTTQGGCSSDINPYKDPGFGGTKFGFFTYGVPNRVGLNQYGAWGRAKAGQDTETILRAYYNFDSIESRSATINVEGYGSYSLDEYVKRIYEVPDSWTDNNLAALKAQAIAARSYALAYTNNGSGSICTTQQCQVFKPDPKGGNWEQAVNATAGQVMIQGGNPIKAWFSSTHGGYIHSSSDIGWNGTSWTKNAQDASGPIGSFSDLNNNAYDKDSPWFYCDWGSRSQYNKTAWLKGDEVADIANVILLVRKNSSNACFVYQTDKPAPPPDPRKGCSATDNWSQERVKQELGKEAFNNVTSVSISADFGSGKTTSVTVSGDAGTQSFSGDEFKNYFNVRAPANIQIVGPLFNVEQR